MATNKAGQFIPSGTAAATFEYFVTNILKVLSESNVSIDTTGKSVDNKVTTANNTLTSILSEVQKTKDFEIILVRCEHTATQPSTIEILKEITTIENSVVVKKYYRADGSEYVPVSEDVFTYMDTGDALSNIIQLLQQLKKPASKSLVTIENSTIGDDYTIPQSYSGTFHNSGTADIFFGNIRVESGMTITWGYDGSDDLIDEITYSIPSEGGIASIVYMTNN